MAWNGRESGRLSISVRTCFALAGHFVERLEIAGLVGGLDAIEQVEQLALQLGLGLHQVAVCVELLAQAAELVLQFADRTILLHRAVASSGTPP